MKTWMTSLLVLGALAAPSFGQAPESEDVDPKTLIERLGDDAHSVRQDTERALERMGGNAVAALQQAANSHDDPEVRWRARRLLERIEKGAGAKADEQLELPPFWTPRDLNSMFGMLFDRLERDFGFDVPRRSFFEEPFFADLRHQMKDLEERLESTGQSVAGSDAQSRALEMHVGPEGVRVEVRERDPSGESSVTTYEAPDLDTFREKYPEVAKQYLGRDGDVFTWKLDPQDFFADLPLLGQAVDATADAGRRLGVAVRPVGSDLRHFLGQQVGQGLLVEQVTSESLAAKLDIRPRDVILEVEGQLVGSAADVRRALAGADSTVTVLVNRGGSQLELQAEHELCEAAAGDPMD